MFQVGDPVTVVDATLDNATGAELLDAVGRKGRVCDFGYEEGQRVYMVKFSQRERLTEWFYWWELELDEKRL